MTAKEAAEKYAYKELPTFDIHSPSNYQLLLKWATFRDAFLAGVKWRSEQMPDEDACQEKADDLNFFLTSQQVRDFVNYIKGIE